MLNKRDSFKRNDHKEEHKTAHTEEHKESVSSTRQLHQTFHPKTKQEKSGTQKDLKKSASQQTSIKPPKTVGTWIEVGNLRLNFELFQLGLDVIRPKDVETSLVVPAPYKFILGSRELQLLDSKETKSNKNSQTQTIHSDHRHLGLDDRSQIQLLNELQSTLNTYGLMRYFLSFGQHFNIAILDLISVYLNYDEDRTFPAPMKPLSEFNRVIYYPQRRDDNFIWVPELQRYINPWLSEKSHQFVHRGFKNIHAVICLLGGAAKGIDIGGENVVSVMKHEDNCKDQIFDRISYDVEGNLYGKVSLAEMPRLLDMVFSFSKDDSRRLSLHVPHFDYMLFALQRFICGRFTFNGFEQFANIALEEGERVIKNISQLCKDRGVDVTFCSPFEILFAEFTEIKPHDETLAESTEKKSHDETTAESTEKKSHDETVGDFIFRTLKIETIKDKILSKEEALALETQLVQAILDKLIGPCSERLKLHQQVWNDILTVYPREEFTNFDDLFKAANAIMTFVSILPNPNNRDANNRVIVYKDYETAVILPLTEKPIHVTVSKYGKKLPKYPKQVFINVLDPYITYDQRHFPKMKTKKGNKDNLNLDNGKQNSDTPECKSDKPKYKSEHKGLVFYQALDPTAHIGLFKRLQIIRSTFDAGKLTPEQLKAELSPLTSPKVASSRYRKS